MSLHKDGDGISDELEEDLQTLPTEDNIRHGIGDGIEEDLNEAENNNFLHLCKVKPVYVFGDTGLAIISTWLVPRLLSSINPT